MIRKFGLGTLVVVLALIAVEDSAFAQMGGMPGMPAMGGTQNARPKRNLKKSKAPVLSPALNLLPEAVTSFEGQFLLRQLPQEQALRNYQQTNRSLDKLQEEIVDQDNQIKTGLKKTTGHRTQFMSYGSYYALGGRIGGGRR